MKANVRTVTLALFAVALLVTCSGRDTNEAPPSSNSGKLGEYDGKPLGQIAVAATFEYPADFSITTTRSEIVKRWGEPVKTVSEKVTSPNDPNTKDTRTKLEYDGFSFLFYTMAARNQEILVATTITSPAYPVSNGMRVGMYKSVMLQKFGEPTFVEKSAYIYTSNTTEPKHMNEELYLSGDTVSRIAIYPDTF